MEKEMIKELMEEFKSSDLSKLKLKCEAFELVLEREKQVVYQEAVMSTTQKQSTPVEEKNIENKTVQKGHALVAPMVGTFYSADSPESAPFVQIGTKVKKGDVVGIIEAMKLMNEVEADKDGEIIEILVQNGDMVECNQPMFIIG